MNNLKFRFWDCKSKRWDYFTLVSINMYLKELNNHTLNGDEPHLYTGLKDKYNNSLFEGDIILYIDTKAIIDSGIYLIGWSKGTNKGGCNYPIGFGFYDEKDDVCPFSLSECCTLSIKLGDKFNDNYLLKYLTYESSCIESVIDDFFIEFENNDFSINDIIILKEKLKKGGDYSE